MPRHKLVQPLDGLHQKRSVLLLSGFFWPPVFTVSVIQLFFCGVSTCPRSLAESVIS
ncbi:unnamed protein product [Penicillium nalgiovense]|nr:unnamed protein product [Penicillium nalgiovense]